MPNCTHSLAINYTYGFHVRLEMVNGTLYSCMLHVYMCDYRGGQNGVNVAVSITRGLPCSQAIPTASFCSMQNTVGKGMEDLIT